MRARSTWHETAKWVTVVAGVATLLLWVPSADAASSKRVRIPKSVPSSVARAPVCDTYAHPKILKVTPDPVRAGQKIRIKGQNFGTKACFKHVSFGRYKAKRFKYVNNTTLEATVPGLKPGLRSVNILTAGGASKYVMLIEKGKRKTRRR